MRTPGLPILLAFAFGIGDEAQETDHTGNQWIVDSATAVASAKSFEIEQVQKMTMYRLVDGKRSGDPIVQNSRAIIEVHLGGPMIVRQTSVLPQGDALVVLRRGSSVVLRVGKGAWQLPSGPFAHLANTGADPFACPAPGEGPDDPVWKVVGKEGEGDRGVVVVETSGDHVARYAQAVIDESLAEVSTGEMKMAIEVRTYTSRHRIARSSNRRLRVTQESKMLQTVTLPGDQLRLVEVESKTTSTYRKYDQVNIEIPAQALALLDRKPGLRESGPDHESDDNQSGGP